MRTILIERQRGLRTVTGTDFPVVDKLEREQLSTRRPTWVVTRGLCNGVPDGATEYRTEREARAAFGE